MPENNETDVVKLAKLEQKHEDLAKDVEELKQRMNTTLDTIQKALTNIENQTSKWKYVGTGIFLAVSGFWILIQAVFGDLSHLLHSIRN